MAAPDPEKEALKEEVTRLRGERSRVQGLKAQLERSLAALHDQRAAALKQQVRTPPLKRSAVSGRRFQEVW